MERSKIISCNFGCDPIEKLSNLLYDNFYKKNKSLERVACIFGGKRPGLFLKDKLSKKIKNSFLPPAIFSMDQFMHYIVSRNQATPEISELELYYLIYNISKNKLGFLGKKQVNFSQFLSWAKEIAAFIDQLDLENVDGASLLDVEKSAAIGYEIPEGINNLLKNIVSIRKDYHSFLRKNKLYSRGLIYLDAAGKIDKESLTEFDKIFFCDLFYLYKTESEVISQLFKIGKSDCIFQGSAKRWPVLGKNSKLLNQPIRPLESKVDYSNIKFYQGFDTQSQVCLAKEILKGVKEKDKTLILLPNPETLIPLLSEASSQLKDFNISLGYPLLKTSLAALFNYLFDAHKSRKNKKYYSRDYLKVLKHPLIKNILIVKDPLLTRILAHKIEEALTGAFDSSVGGTIFVLLKSIEDDQNIYKECQKTLESIDYNLSLSDYRKIINQIHDLFFRGWEKIDSFEKFSQQIKLVLDCLSNHQLLLKFPLELKSLDAIYKIQENFSSLSFSDKTFVSDQIWDIFKQRIESTRISFKGLPLSGTQILGLFETRALRFKNVIVLDANEGILPKLKVTEPLIPAEVMMSLGLPALSKEEEIQRYHLMRLVESAKDVSLIWAKNQALEKSRFVENIIWQKQKKGDKINLDLVPQLSFSLSFPRPGQSIKKSPKIIEFLKNSTYSVSRINTYLECPLQFYYKYVLGLAEKKDLLKGVEDSQIGTFIHEFLYEVYKKFLGKKPVFDSQFNNYFKKVFNRKYDKEIVPKMQSDSFLLKEIIKARLDKFFDQESQRAPNIEKIEALEKEYSDKLRINETLLNFKYIVDRIDLSRGDNLLVIDYKTGGGDVVPAKLTSLEKMNYCRQEIRAKIKSFQLPLYYYFVQKRFKEKKVNAYVYNLRTAEITSFISSADWLKRKKVVDTCLGALRFILDELFDPGVPFSPDKDSRRCQYCPFYNLCS
ncbi:MAG: PD-(D/E)XK nuclease family protein [Candidatus Omnitrophica bacterium]|nr:PD-(D/E)XK nuclease family protein [Candidatus Omnitrophota bacterium]MCF7894724.1 PD-(D/E)XK nuclease family protein [Candidatus Omnitrophota bacterium]